jgi:hypothetical protein
MAQLVGIAGAALVLTTGVAAAATSHTSSSHPAFHIQAPPKVQAVVPAAPSGCDLYHYCTYNQGNGGDLCEQMGGTGNLNSACANHNDSGFNNRTVYSVDLFWGSGETGAFYNLCHGCYLLYMTQNHYNQCKGGGHSCSGFGQQIGYNLASVRF